MSNFCLDCVPSPPNPIHEPRLIYKWRKERFRPAVLEHFSRSIRAKKRRNVRVAHSRKTKREKYEMKFSNFVFERFQPETSTARGRMWKKKNSKWLAAMTNEIFEPIRYDREYSLFNTFCAFPIRPMPISLNANKLSCIFAFSLFRSFVDQAKSDTLNHCSLIKINRQKPQNAECGDLSSTEREKIMYNWSGNSEWTRKRGRKNLKRKFHLIKMKCLWIRCTNSQAPHSHV